MIDNINTEISIILKPLINILKTNQISLSITKQYTPTDGKERKSSEVFQFILYLVFFNPLSDLGIL